MVDDIDSGKVKTYPIGDVMKELEDLVGDLIKEEEDGTF
jgi:hypothetical protein